MGEAFNPDATITPAFGRAVPRNGVDTGLDTPLRTYTAQVDKFMSHEICCCREHPSLAGASVAAALRSVFDSRELHRGARSTETATRTGTSTDAPSRKVEGRAL